MVVVYRMAGLLTGPLGVMVDDMSRDEAKVVEGEKEATRRPGEWRNLLKSKSEEVWVVVVVIVVVVVPIDKRMMDCMDGCVWTFPGMVYGESSHYQQGLSFLAMM